MEYHGEHEPPYAENYDERDFMDRLADDQIDGYLLIGAMILLLLMFA